MNWDVALVLHAGVTWLLCGLIWFVQVVHYPLFAAVGNEAFVAYEREHCRRIAWIVLPAMTSEAALAIWIWWFSPPAHVATATFGAAALGAVWITTFLIQVPCHRRLSVAADPAAIRWLIQSNWLRTAAWSSRGIAAAWLLTNRG